MGRSRKVPQGSSQLPFDAFTPESNWIPPDLNSLPSWAEAKRVGIDTETRDEHLKALGPGVRRGAYICGFSFAIEDGERPYYLPIRHAGGGNLDPDQVLRYMRDQAKYFRGQLVGANMGYDLDHMAKDDIHFREVEYFRDIQIADPLINELHTSYSMAKIAERWGEPGKDEALLRDAAYAYHLDAKSEMWKLHSKYVGPYGEQDAVLPLRLLRRQERVIEEQNLWEIYNLESQVLPVLVKMRRRGVRIDLDKLSEVERWSLAEELGEYERVRQATGIRLSPADIWRAEALAAPLRHIGIVFKPGVKVSIDKVILGGIDHPVAAAILRARKLNKLRTTFAKSMRTYMTNGRIHCTFNQLRKTKDGEEGEDSEDGGGRYGRLSCSDPNLQQQPARDEFAKMWRSIYIPEDGELWASADYSQQEPRWLTHYAELCGLSGAHEAAQKYRDDPTTDNHDMMTRIIHGAAVDEWEKAVYKKHRTFCKQIFLGKCYGMGGPKLCRNLGLPTKIAPHWDREKAAQGIKVEVAGDEGQAIIDKFDRGAPYVKGLARKCEARAKELGYIITVLGRRCRFPEKEGGGWDWTHKALNRLIQGSSADQTKRAMVEADRAGIALLLQVHDELDLSVPAESEAQRLADIMRTCVPSNVPAKVDVEIGESWGGSM